MGVLEHADVVQVLIDERESVVDVVAGVLLWVAVIVVAVSALSRLMWLRW